ncbi:MAG: hypothetical protein FJ297_00250 [Planctomycetes bacterium]|nr:hypothetical protein [Planctomycetota bacterium]
MDRRDALALMHEYTISESLRRHMMAVEGGMGAYAERWGEDVERGRIVGLLHDFDIQAMARLNFGTEP